MWNDEQKLVETRDTDITTDERSQRVDPEAARAGELSFEHRYTPKGLLGRGGMGEVFLCRDTFIGRDVALKLMREKHRDHVDARDRFLREASVQGQLEHPAIVPIYDLGNAPAFGAFFTMKRIRGETLREVLQRLRAGDADTKAKYSRAKLLGSFHQLCLAIDFAHRRGVIHRDLKPANVMLGDFGEIYILDWGIAKVFDAKTDLESRPGQRTLEGAVIGTPGYMPPEQSEGRLDRITPQSDIYSLGVVLSELLVAQSGDEPRPPELEGIVEKATQPLAQHRFENAREMAEAISRWLDGDRDLVLRRALAEKQSEKANTALELALSVPAEREEEARADAMREISRALALDPENVSSRQALMQLLLNPPKQLPRAAQKERERVDSEARAAAAKYALTGVVSLIAFLPILWWSGIKDFGLAIACLAAWIVLLALGLYGAVVTHRAGPPLWGRHMSIAAALLLFVLLGRLMGPLLIVPALISALLPSLMLNIRGAGGRTIFIAAQVVMLTPLVLELLGVLPKSYAFEGGAMIIHPQLAVLSEAPILTGLVVLSIATMAVPALLLRRVRRVLDAADSQRLLHAWYLRTLVDEVSTRRPESGSS